MATSSIFFRRLSAIIIFALLIQSAAKGQDQPGCIRNAYKLIIPVDAKVTYQQDLPAGPYLLPDTSVQIYPGETINLEATIHDGHLEKLTPVCTVIQPDSTITITLSQVLERKSHKIMMLKISNPLPRNLSYNAYFFPLNGKKWVQTDVLPVNAKMSGFESWPTLIVSLALRNFALN